MNQNQQFPLKFKGAQLHQPDINSFNPKQWLTAEAIYFGILYTSPNICPQIKILDPSLATLLLFENDFEDLLPIKHELLNKDYLITAINDSQGGTGSHWGTLLFHNFQFYLFDSGSSQQLYENAQDLAKKITSILKNDESILQANIPVQKVENVPHQNNNHDCGVYAIAIISELNKQISEEKPWNFNNITPETVANLRVTLRTAIQKL